VARGETKTFEILEARKDDDLVQVGKLFEQYADELGVDLGFQNFAHELQHIREVYRGPGGCVLLARRAGQVIGCVALRRFDEDTCEMKRLYVRSVGRGTGVGRELAMEIIQRAKEAGYKKMVLDTLESLTAARALYRSLGFHEVAPYYENPLKGAVYMEIRLSEVRRTEPVGFLEGLALTVALYVVYGFGFLFASEILSFSEWPSIAVGFVTAGLAIVAYLVITKRLGSKA
jgi:putative acetyltransferase